MWAEITSKLLNNIPFCFVKMNDGEIQCILNHNSVISRGSQKSSSNLAMKLKQILLAPPRDNYIIGHPCEYCYPNMYEYVKQYNHTPVNANILINSNFNKSLELFKTVFTQPDKNILYVCCDSANTNNLPFKPSQILRVPDTDSFSVYDNLASFKPRNNTIVLLCCGPLGRILASEWYIQNPTLTCIELGSFFDPWTISKAYMYHTGTLPLCSGCNPTLADGIDVTHCNHIEQYYWNDLSLDFYKKKYQVAELIRRVYNINMINQPTDKYFIDWMLLKLNRENGMTDDNLEVELEKHRLLYPDRVESVIDLARTFKEKRKKLDFYWKVSDLAVPTHKDKYVIDDLYRWKILDDIVIEEYYDHNYEASYKAWQKLMSRKEHIPSSLVEHCVDNGRYAKIMLDSRNPIQNFRNDLDMLPHRKIPKIFHFIYITGGSCHPFIMAHYIAIKTCIKIQKPDFVYLWYNNESDDLKKNKYWIESKKLVISVKIRPPEYVNNRYIPYKQHQADVMRLLILEKFGGVYCDLDILSVHPLDGSGSVKPCFENPTHKNPDLYTYDFVISRESDSALCNCLIMVRPNHPFIKQWIKQYEDTYDTDWNLLSVRHPNEMAKSEEYQNICILKRPSILPFMYSDTRFFRTDIQPEVENSLTVHLWDTETFKQECHATDFYYFEKYPDSSFTKMFYQYGF
jgi:mannosyltransferase OCH1-like enzyme